MDTADKAVALYEQGYSQRDIAAKLDISTKKVLQILVTAGAVETDESRLYAQGYSVKQICSMLDKKSKSVQGRIPYQKGMYNSDDPSENALRIRKSRSKSGG